MKYHTALKFVAIVLCAAALLGAVGGALGIGALTTLGLYDKDVDQFYQEYVLNNGKALSQSVGPAYASETLGGCPTDFVMQHYGQYSAFRGPYYSYQLKDAEGNVLLEGGYDLLPEEEVRTYTFPVTGKYMYLVSAVFETTETGPADFETAETDPALQEEEPAETYPPTEEIRLEADETLPAGEPMVMSAMPEEMDDIGAEQTGEAAADEAAADEAAAITEPPAEPAPENEGAAEEPAAQAEEPAADEAVPAAEPAPSETLPPETLAETLPPETTEAPPEETLGLPSDSVPGTVNGRPVTDYQQHSGWYHDGQLHDSVDVTYVLLDMPEYTLELHLVDGATDMDAFLPMLRALRHYRQYLLPVLVWSLLMFAAFGVYLCCAAGRRPKSDEVKAGGLNRIPLELYAGAVVGFGIFLAVGGVEGTDYLIRQDSYVGFSFAVSFAYAACLLLVGFVFALVAQMKTPGWFWLKNSLCGHCLRLLGFLWRSLIKGGLWFAKALEQKIIPFLGRFCKGLWRLLRKLVKGLWSLLTLCLKGLFGALAKAWRFGADKVKAFLGLLPLTWQWLVTGCAMVLLTTLLCATGSLLGVFIAILLTIGAVMVGSNAFGLLLESTRRMSRGDLNARIDERRLFGAFRDFAKNLNALANVAVVAAQKQLKSERMKTELITNVSHDIKTPLTSIISYVDLLQKPHTEEEEQQYLEVLSRQSLQLKKLIDDLIEMSKASTGNMSVNIIRVDAVEAVNQALGEFDDKLEKAQLTPIFRHSDSEAPMLADGKLLWRVLHNLLSNAVKYALPGTRLYIDVMCLEGKVILSMKNVSREELNVDAEELMERFVRGDGSRKTEGSGLGLNIAKSMMELQHGSLQLLVDGDLFKVTLIFPGA